MAEDAATAADADVPLDRPVGSSEHDGADAADAPDAADEHEQVVGAAIVLVLVVGVALAWAARTGAVQLLVVIAVLQGLLAFTLMLSLRLPGRIGGILLAGLTSSGADVAVSVWPHSRLGPLLAVLGLAVPAMFIHQLRRGVSRVRLVASLGATGLLVVAETALPALLQLRHEFRGPSIGTDPAFAMIIVLAGALLAGYFADLVYAAPRFDEQVPRGLFGVVVSIVVGAAIGQVGLRDSPLFADGRSLFLGAALGAVVALLAVAVSFMEHGVPLAEAGFARRARPLLGVIMPLALAAPVALVLCLAVSR